MTPQFWIDSLYPPKRRIICITRGLVESIHDGVPNRARFMAGGVSVQLGEGAAGVEAEFLAGKYTELVGQADALSGDAVGLFADAEGFSGRGNAVKGGVESGTNSLGGDGHGFFSCQQGVGNGSIVAYNAMSSGLDSFFSFALFSGPRSDNAGVALEKHPGISFSPFVFA